MNVFNRLIVVLGIVVVVLFAMMVIVLAWAYPDGTILKLGKFVTYLNDVNTNGTKVIITLAGSFVILVGVSFLVLELAPRARQDGSGAGRGDGHSGSVDATPSDGGWRTW